MLAYHHIYQAHARGGGRGRGSAGGAVKLVYLRWQESCRNSTSSKGAGKIISKSCSFSPETEFTPLILASKSEFS